MFRNVPLSQPRPDAHQFINTLMGYTRSARPPLVEYIVDDMVMKPIVTELLGRAWVDDREDREAQKAYLDNFIEFWFRMGYDFAYHEQDPGLTRLQLAAPDTVPGSTKPRLWVDEHQGVIRNWEDFERYPWPNAERMDFFRFEYLNEHLPEGMGLISAHGAGIFECLSWLMSYEGLCFALYDNPDLVQAVADKIGELMTDFYRHLLTLDRLIAVLQGDDMGFRTHTLIRPEDLRKYVLPWHKRIAEMVHQRGIPYFLHSCGNIVRILDDLISDVKIDGKHSFEDAVLPVHEFQALYGDRIATLGGLDINILALSSPEEVRRKTRWLIETCGSRGRYAIGSGNSIPNYVPVSNYLAMVDEALDGAEK
jgi:uroporphyrinogen decarboxylase